MKLYLFDFDGTLTTKDTLFDFLRFSFPEEFRQVYIKFIPLFIGAKCKILKTARVKEKFISSFLKGKNKEELSTLSQKYFEDNKDTLLRSQAVRYIKDIIPGESKYIVTASLDIWVIPFAEYLGAKLIPTRSEFKNNIFTGKFASPNCNNKEKVVRIVKEIKLSDFNEIYAFGDTKGDKYMLELSTHPHFKYFE